MLIFWIIIALLILLALWFVLPPLFQSNETQTNDDLRAANVSIYQNQYQELEDDLRNGLIAEDEYQREKEGLERRLLEDVKTANGKSSRKLSQPNRKIAYAVAAAIPVAAVSFYLAVGNQKALSVPSNGGDMAPSTQQAGSMSQQQIEQNVAKLSKRLEANPNDAQGWLMLGRSYMVLERFADAASAFGRATSINGNDANAWADYAESLALANGQRMAGKPLDAANRALQLDPKNEKALALAGSAAFEANDYRKAIDYWQKLLPLLPPNSDAAKTVSDQLAKAKELAAGQTSR